MDPVAQIRLGAELLTSRAVGVLRATMLVPNLRRFARLDPLTGLGHHGAFSGALSEHAGSGRHALILVDVDAPADAIEMGRRMRTAVLKAEAGISVSIGIATGQKGEAETTLRDRADAALYRVKAAGRDDVAIDASLSGELGYDVAA